LIAVLALQRKRYLLNGS